MQINSENSHKVACILEEIFGEENFIANIVFRKKSLPLGAKTLETMHDHLLLYSKNREQFNLKYRQLYQENKPEDATQHWRNAEFPNGEITKIAPIQIGSKDHPNGTKYFRLISLIAPSFSEKAVFPVEFNGKIYNPPYNGCWIVSKEKIDLLIKQKRITIEGGSLVYKLYFDDFPYKKLTNLWHELAPSYQKYYVVQTTTQVLEKCILMTTAPGDLVIDPTCGSGTTACVAEQWGRRWITCDTSRVAITLAKQRLMTAKFDYYELAHPDEGIRSGFKYKTVPHITLKSIANNEPPKEETLYDQPYIEKGKVRVTGPFTVEAVPCLRVKPFDGSTPKIDATNEQLARTGETGKQAEWRDELKATGIRAVGNKVISFSRIEPMIATKYLHAEGEILEEDGTNKKAYISFGPDYGPLEQRQVELAINEARSLKSKPDFVIFAAFHFDPEAAKDIDQINWQGVKVLKAQMSVDLLTKDLRKKRSSNQSYWLIGQPDVEVIKIKARPHESGELKYKVKVNGFDYYDPISGEIISKGTKHIAMWFLDTDYDERSLYPEQVFFPEGDSKRDWTRLAKALNGEVNEELIEHFRGVESLPFSIGEHKKIAVKIIDTRGIESFVIKGLE